MKNFFKHLLIVLVSVVLVCGILYGTVPDFKNFINAKIFHKSDKKEVVYYPENLYVEDIITASSNSVFFTTLNDEYKTVRVTTPSTKYPATLYLMDTKTKKLKPISTKQNTQTKACYNGYIVVNSPKLIEIYDIKAEKITATYEYRTTGANIKVFNDMVFIGEQTNGFSLIDIKAGEMKTYTKDQNDTDLPKNLGFMLATDNEFYFSSSLNKLLYSFNLETETISEIGTTAYSFSVSPMGVIKLSDKEYIFSSTKGAYKFNTETKEETLLPAIQNSKHNAIVFDGKYVMYHGDYFYMKKIDSEEDFTVATSDVVSTTIRDDIATGNTSSGREPFYSVDGFLIYTYGCSEKVSDGVYILDGYVFDFTNKTIKKYSAQ